MPIEFRCSQCGKLLRTGDDTAGKQARCPACGNVLPVPARSQAAIGVSSPFSPSSGFAPGQAVGGSPFATAPAAQFSPGSENPYQSPGIYVGPSSGWDGSVGFELAGRGARLAGATIDGLITVASIVPAYVTLFLFESGNGNAADTMVIAFLLLLVGGFLAANIVQWVLITKSGQSLGKKAIGTRIVRIEDGQLPGFVKGVILRGWLPFLFGQICGLFPLVDACWIFGEERRCVHDLIANTRVVVAR